MYAPPSLIRFGLFTLEIATGELKKNGLSVRLAPQPSRVLVFLVRRAGQIVTREEIRDHIWGDETFVDFDKGLNFCIKQIRIALRDDAERPTYIQTLPRRGYRFIGQMEEVVDNDNHDRAELRESRSSNSEVAVKTEPTAWFRNRRTWWFWRVAALMFAFTSVVVFGIYLSAFSKSVKHFHNFTITKIIDSANVSSVAISPDGKYLFQVLRKDGKQSLWMRHIATNSNTEVITSSDCSFCFYYNLSFSPDGNYIYFVRIERGPREVGELWKAPVLGGVPRRLVLDIDSNISFSPDAQHIVFARGYPNKNSDLVVTSPDGREEKRFPITTSGELVGTAWSPSGSIIVVGLNADDMHDDDDKSSRLVAVDAATGKERMFFHSDKFINGLTWLPDASGLLVLWRDRGGFGNHQIGFVSYPSGYFKRVSNDTADYAVLSVSRDGRALATVLAERRSILTVSSTTQATGAAESQMSSRQSWRKLTWTKQGAMFIQQGTGLVALDKDGSGPNALLGDDSLVLNPSACANGRYVFFGSLDGIWRVDSSGGNLTRITTAKEDGSPTCEPEGTGVFYLKRTGSGFQANKIMRVPQEGGEAEELGGPPVAQWDGVDISNDGKMLGYPVFQDGRMKAAVVSVEPGKKTHILEFEKPYNGFRFRFTPDGQSIAYRVHNEVGEAIWVQPMNGSAGRFVTSFKPELIWDFHWSFDGKKLAVLRTHSDSDAVVIRDLE